MTINKLLFLFYNGGGCVYTIVILLSVPRKITVFRCWPYRPHSYVGRIGTYCLMSITVYWPGNSASALQVSYQWRKRANINQPIRSRELSLINLYGLIGQFIGMGDILNLESISSIFCNIDIYQYRDILIQDIDTNHVINTTPKFTRMGFRFYNNFALSIHSTVQIIGVLLWVLQNTS